MRWKDERRSENVEDRRGEIPPAVAAGAAAPVILRLLPALVRTKLGRTILITGVVLIVGGRLLGIDVLSLFAGGGGAQQGEVQFSQAEQEMADFVSVVLADTEDTWHEIFRQAGQRYREPTLVLFTGRVASACGMASAAVGPFYCPGDQKLYIDLSFFQDLKSRHGAPGDFAQAYVVAHEIGHHIQNITGINRQVSQSGEQSQGADGTSVRVELQADCFAGVWGHSTYERGLLESGDLEEGLAAAAAVGDDRIQEQATGQVNPETWTHGSSEERSKWFLKGFESGDPQSCDTFRGRV